ncbi:Pentatricopeptide repeat-containing protein [Nymphaea thermarum]|nr:Pentatricopeptide repeat-containing protein [Nymphaea thermarum]
MAEERNSLPLPPPPMPLGNDSMGTVAVLPTAADIQSAVASTDRTEIHLPPPDDPEPSTSAPISFSSTSASISPAFLLFSSAPIFLISVSCKNVAVSSSSTLSSSSQSQPDLDPLETRFRSVLPTLLRSYVSPSSPGKDREIIAILKLLTLVYKIDGEMLRNFYVCAELIHMYGGLGCIDSTCQVKDVISWTTMINMYGSAGCPVNALRFFWQMRSANVEPDMVSMVALLSACAMLEQGDLMNIPLVLEATMKQFL